MTGQLFQNQDDSSEDEGYQQVWEKENRDRPPPPPPKKKFNPDQFNMLKVLGKGSFGKVQWVTDSNVTPEFINISAPQNTVTVLYSTV